MVGRGVIPLLEECPFYKVGRGLAPAERCLNSENLLPP